MSTICSLINSTSKLCRIDECPAKGTFLTLSLEPVDSLVDLLATFRTRNFQRQIVEKHGLIKRYTKLLELAKLGLIIALIRLLEKMIRERFENGVILDRYNTRWRNELSHLENLTSSALISKAWMRGRRAGLQFEQEFFSLFRAETVSAYDWRDRIGDFCVADDLAKLDTVHVMRYSTRFSLHLRRTSSCPPDQR